MYNRYVPQSDGSYRKNRMVEQRQNQQVQSGPKTAAAPQPQIREPGPHQPRPTQNGGSILGFLRQLLPKDFDTGDLLIVLLLLLMASDSGEGENTALLTLALYCFM